MKICNTWKSVMGQHDNAFKVSQRKLQTGKNIKDMKNQYRWNTYPPIEK